MTWPLPQVGLQFGLPENRIHPALRKCLPTRIAHFLKGSNKEILAGTKCGRLKLNAAAARAYNYRAKYDTLECTDLNYRHSTTNVLSRRGKTGYNFKDLPGLRAGRDLAGWPGKGPQLPLVPDIEEQDTMFGERLVRRPSLVTTTLSFHVGVPAELLCFLRSLLVQENYDVRTVLLVDTINFKKGSPSCAITVENDFMRHSCTNLIVYRNKT